MSDAEHHAFEKAMAQDAGAATRKLAECLAVERAYIAGPAGCGHDQLSAPIILSFVSATRPPRGIGDGLNFRGANGDPRKSARVSVGIEAVEEYADDAIRF